HPNVQRYHSPPGISLTAVRLAPKAVVQLADKLLQFILHSLHVDLLRCEHGLQMSMLPSLLDQAQCVLPAQTTRSGERLRQLWCLPIIQEHPQIEPLLLTPEMAHWARPLLSPGAPPVVYTLRQRATPTPCGWCGSSQHRQTFQVMT